jgi:hypothetical protein
MTLFLCDTLLSVVKATSLLDGLVLPNSCLPAQHKSLQEPKHLKSVVLPHVLQWVFIGEGIPSVLLGICLPWLLPDGPHSLGGTVSSWLAPHELQLLQADVSTADCFISIELLATHASFGLPVVYSK